jgi:hypothetical protein
MPTNRAAVAAHRLRCWGGLESTFGAGPSAAAGPVAADAFAVLNLQAPQMNGRRVIPNLELTGVASKKPPTRGAYDPVQLKAEMQLRGSGAAATPPDYGFLFRAAAFSETIGASVVYAMREDAAESAWIWAVTEDGSVGMLYAGIGIDTIEAQDLGAKEALVSFAGMAAAVATICKVAVGTGGISNVATSLPLGAGHGWQIPTGCVAYIKITEGGNSEVMKVTALDTSVSPDVATVTRNILGAGAFAFTIAATITPYVPTRTEASTAQIGEHVGAFTYDEGGGATALQAVKHSVSVKTGVSHWDKEAFLDTRAGLVKEALPEDAVGLTSDFVFATGSAGPVQAHVWREQGTDLSLLLTVGNTAGNRCKVAMPDAQVVEVNAPLNPSGALKGTVGFRGYDITGTGQPVTFTFD